MDRLEAQKLALNLMADAEIIRDGWTFGWLGQKTRSRCGLCNHSTKTISLAPLFVDLNDLDSVRDTVLHEIAHVLAGYEEGHGKLWKRFALDLGATPRATMPQDEVAMPATESYKWEAVCRDCGAVLRRRRISQKHARGMFVHQGCKSKLHWRRITQQPNVNG